jgi:hypothetical protein
MSLYLKHRSVFVFKMLDTPEHTDIVLITVY